jgi:hypothetical protein
VSKDLVRSHEKNGQQPRLEPALQYQPWDDEMLEYPGKAEKFKNTFHFKGTVLKA